MAIHAKRVLAWIFAAVAGGAVVHYWPEQGAPRQEAVKEEGPSLPGASLPATDRPVKPVRSGDEVSRSLTASMPAASTPVVASAYEPLTNAVVFGLIRDVNGEPVPEARIDISAPPKKTVLAVVNTAGNFTAASVPPGTWTVKASAPGHRDAIATVEIPDDIKYKRVDLTLQPSRVVKIRFVTKDGRRLSTVLAELGLRAARWGDVRTVVLATKEPLPEILPIVPYTNAVMSRTGEFRESRSKEFDGELELLDELPIHVTAAVQHLAFERKILTEYVESLDLTIDDAALLAALGTIRCQVIDAATGTALAGAGVNLGNRQGGGQYGVTDADGVFTFKNVVPGLIVVAVNAKDLLESYRQYVHLEHGQSLPLRIELQKLVKLQCSVVDSTGEFVKGPGSLQAVPEISSARPIPGDLGSYLMTKGDATFYVFLAKRPYLLTARYPGYAITTQRVNPGTGSMDPIRVVLVKGTVVTLRFSGSPYTRPLVLVRNAAGDIVWSEYAAPVDVPLTLSPGTYRLDIHGTGVPSRSQEFSVAESPIVVTVSL